MKTSTIALVGALVLVPALGGCQTETTAGDTARIVSDDTLDGAVDLNDSLASDIDDAAADAGTALDSAGATLGRGAEEAGAAVGAAADRAEDVLDSNVDVGENAENQGD